MLIKLGEKRDFFLYVKFSFSNLKEVDCGALIEFLGGMLQNTKYDSLEVEMLLKIV